MYCVECRLLLFDVFMLCIALQHSNKVVTNNILRNCIYQKYMHNCLVYQAFAYKFDNCI